LQGMFPTLEALLHSNNPQEPSQNCTPSPRTTGSPQRTGRRGDANSWNRLVWAFKSFMRVLATPSRPVILCVDDLQCADGLSLDLLFGNFMVNLKYTMVVGCYRSNEVVVTQAVTTRNAEPLSNASNHSVGGKEVHLLVTKLDNLNDQIPFTELSLSRQTRRRHLDESTTTTVSNSPHPSLLGGDNDNEDIQGDDNDPPPAPPATPVRMFKQPSLRRLEAAALTEDDLDEIAFRLHKLPAPLQQALAIASFLRTTFPVPALHRIMERQNCALSSTDELIQLLHVALEQGLLEHVITPGDTTSFRFAHGQIKQTAHAELVPSDPDALDNMKQQIGQALNELATTCDYGSDFMLFMAAEQMNFELRFG